MNVILISQCHKNALKETRRIIDQFAERTGERTWQTAITSQGLSMLKILLKKSARKNTSVACHWVRGKNRTELMWIVGNASCFNSKGAVPTNTTEKDILKYDSENHWHTAAMITLLARISALFHDFGKSCLDFQNRLRKNEKTKNLIRHEWISVIMFLAYVNGEDDKDWLTRLADENFEDGWMNRIDSKLANPFKDLPPLASVVCWLIISHHRMPVPDVLNDNLTLPESIKADWCRTDLKGLESQNYWKFAEGTPADSALWRKAASRAAKRALTLYDGFNLSFYDPYVINLARMTLMLSDHIYSGIHNDKDRAGGDKDFPLYANTYKDDRNQRLDEHLLGVERLCGTIMHSLPMADSLTGRLAGYRQFAKRSEDKRFRWQDKSYETALSVRETAELGGFFGINMASTGCGKTRANARIMYALSHPEKGARFSVALGLRTLTLQTGREYMEMLGLDDSELAVMTGGTAVRELFNMNNEFRSSESADWLLDAGSHVYYEGGIDDTVMGQWLKKTKGADKLVSAPVLVCTIDHLMPASEGTAGGRQIAPMLRLLTGDLVLDEPDDYDVGDMYALTRLIYFAGLLGSRVLFSSATVTPSIAEGLFAAYSAGREVFNRNRGVQHGRKVVCAWFDEFSCKAETDVSSDRFSGLHAEFIKTRVEKLIYADSRRHAAILDVDSVSELPDKIFSAVRELHHSNSAKDVKTGASVSIGLVRIANITPLVTLFKDFCKTAADKDVAFHVCCYHSRFPLILRSEIEKNLDRILKRGGRNFMDDEIVRRAISKYPDKKEHIFVVFASPVAEVGRDHDYDWAVAEPSSMRSIIQLAGRIRRHRPQPYDVINMYILGKNIRAMKGDGIAYNRPGYEDKNFRLKAHDIKTILKKEQYEKITSVPRITESEQPEPDMNIGDLEHSRLKAVMTGNDGRTVMPVTKFWDSRYYLSAYMQKIKPFRAGNKDTEYVLWCNDDTEEMMFMKMSDNGKYDTAERNIKWNTEEMPADYFISLDYTKLVEELAERLEITPSACSLKFGGFTMRELEPGDKMYFDNYLGIYKEEE